MKNSNLEKPAPPTSRTLATQLNQYIPNLLPMLKITPGLLRQDTQEQRLTVQVRTPQGHSHQLLILVKHAVFPGRLREGLRHLREETLLSSKNKRSKPSYPVLASTFLSPRVREICLEEKVGYVDLAGNYHLELNPLYLEKIVDKNPFPARGRPASLFSPISSRIIRVLLEEPKRSWRLSELARVSQVSLGQSSGVTRRLMDEEYVTKEADGLRVKQPAKLLEAWREQNPMRLNDSVAYYSFEQQPERLMTTVAQLARANRWPYAMTSFAAASLIAPFVRGIVTTSWYVSDGAAVETWVKALDLRPAESGANVLLLVPYNSGVFYRSREINGITVVGNVQLYLDLSSSPSRGMEQAEFLRQQVLGF